MVPLDAMVGEENTSPPLTNSHFFAGVCAPKYGLLPVCCRSWWNIGQGVSARPPAKAEPVAPPNSSSTIRKNPIMLTIPLRIIFLLGLMGSVVPFLSPLWLRTPFFLLPTSASPSSWGSYFLPADSRSILLRQLPVPKAMCQKISSAYFLDSMILFLCVLSTFRHQAC